MTNVTVNTYTHSVIYVADNILKSLKDIIRLSGLDPTAFVGDWPSNMLAVQTWLNTQDLLKVNLEIYDPKTDRLIIRWDIEIAYAWSGGEGGFWTDTTQLKYAIQKAGVAPSEARYRLVLDTKPGRPDVIGWSTVTYRSIEGMIRQSLGTTVEHSGLGANTSYLRRA
jgi:hypothetical protein